MPPSFSVTAVPREAASSNVNSSDEKKSAEKNLSCSEKSTTNLNELNSGKSAVPSPAILKVRLLVSSTTLKEASPESYAAASVLPEVSIAIFVAGENLSSTLVIIILSEWVSESTVKELFRSATETKVSSPRRST